MHAACSIVTLQTSSGTDTAETEGEKTPCLVPCRKPSPLGSLQKIIAPSPHTHTHISPSYKTFFKDHIEATSAQH